MYQGRIGLVIYGGNYDKMNLEELCVYIKELFEEQKGNTAGYRIKPEQISTTRKEGRQNFEST